MNLGPEMWTSLEEAPTQLHSRMSWCYGYLETGNSPMQTEMPKPMNTPFGGLCQPIGRRAPGTPAEDHRTDFLGGHRSQGLDTAVETLLFSAIRWMKRAERAETISLALSYRNQLEDANVAMTKPWVESMSDTMETRYSRPCGIKSWSTPDAIKKAPLSRSAAPDRSLAVQGALCIELICTFARALCELTTKHSGPRQEPSGDLLSSIEKLRRTVLRGSAPICMDSASSATKASAADSPPRYEPQRLDTSDLVRPWPPPAAY